jgi:glutamyl-tRNA synthetase
MDEDLRRRVRETAEAHALYNALEHGGDAQVDAVMGPLMADNPEFREHGEEVPGVVAEAVQRVNDLDDAARRERLGELDAALLEELDAEEDEEDEHPLSDLPNVEEYDEVRMRVAPNPNGPWHLGNARMGAVVGTYRDRYDGWLLCRFDDTDPETKRPDLAAYDAIIEDLAYLGFEPDDVARASDRLETYYERGRELIEAGGAYACTCPQAEFSEMKNAAEACPHRNRSAEESAEIFEAMVDGEYDAGEMVIRVRTDIDHRNPALRDWVAFRMVDTPHPRESASEYRCWPMLDFQSGVDDHEFDVTHIIRGIDLQDSAKRQQFVYDYFDWEYPEVLHWGRIQVDEYDVPMSTSTIKERVESGALSGYDDPRAPTLASLRRRGIRGEAVTDALVELGTSTSAADLSMSAVYANNRDIVDPEATRRFFVRDGVEVPVLGGPEAGHPPVHPDFPDRGDRAVPAGETVLVEPDDVPGHEERVWLKGFGCVRYTREAFQYVGDDIDAVREEGVPVVHWVPAAESVPVRLRAPDGDVDGRAEPGFADQAVDDVVQFERVGFARVDSLPEGEKRAVAYFSHS